jgi:mediator of RNA polymerase II transcription subunit 25
LEKLRNLLSEKLVALIYPDYLFSIDRSVGLQEVIWQGQVEWKETPRKHEQIKDHYMLNQTEKYCANVNIKASIKHGTPEVVSANWPSSLVMQLMPVRIIRRVGKEFFSDSMTVLFDLPAEEHFNLLKSHLNNTGLSGVVHFMGEPDCEVKVLILLYSTERKVFVGFIPRDQMVFIQRIREEIQRENSPLNHYTDP